MTSRNPLAWVVDGLKVRPEEPELPGEVDEFTVDELISHRNRLREISQTATELRRLVDAVIVEKLAGAGHRYGDTIVREGALRRKVVVRDVAEWWELVVEALKATPSPDRLLAALYPADKLKVTGLPFLAEALSVESIDLVDVEYRGKGLTETPRSRAPKYLQRLEDGQSSYSRSPERQAEVEQQVAEIFSQNDSRPDS